MAQCMESIATKPDNLSSDLRYNIVEKEKRLLQLPSNY